MHVMNNDFAWLLTVKDYGPYQLWLADRWKCLGCHHEILTGHGKKPIAEHYEPEFKGQVEHWKPTVEVIE
jgi:hypothetical protein